MSETPGGHPADILAANLAALAQWNPRAAALVAQATVPAEWQGVAGSDGTATYRRELGEGRVEWLGGTSMPRASAVPIIQSLDPARNGGNALGIGMGTGFEWQAVVARLARHQMLYVLETNFTYARLALAVCDLTEVLRAGKLVLILEDGGSIAVDDGGAEGQLLEFLAAHPGFDAPSALHPMATLTPERRNALLTLGERITRRALAECAVRYDAAAKELSRLPAVQQPDQVVRPVLALTITPAHAFDRTLPQMVAALPKARTLALDDHTTTSGLCRAQEIVEHRPARIVSDLFRGQLALPLPQHLPVVTVVPPIPTPAYWANLPAPAALGPADRIVCHAAYYRALLLAHGFAESAVQLVPLAVSSSDPAPVTEEAPTDESRVALLADLPDLGAAANGFSLPTHAALWQAARDIIAEAALTTTPDHLPDILRRAQSRTGIALTDAGLSQTLLRMLRHILLPGASRMALARSLHESGVALKLVGVGWQQAGLAVPMVPFTAPDVWAGVGAVLHFDPAAVIHPATLAAPRRGIPIVAAPHPWHADAAQYPATLPTILRLNTDFVSPAAGQLAQVLKALLRSAPQRRQLAASAAEHLNARHTWGQRDW